MPVGPGETFPYRCKLSVHKPGPFEAKIVLYLEDNGIREATLTVRGVGVRPPGLPEEPADAPEPPP